MPNRISSVFLYGSVVLFLSVIIFSCNDRRGYEKYSLGTTVELLIYEDMVLQLFYKLNADDSYSESLSIKKPVSANKDFQKVYFELPSGIIPKNIRIDFGEKPGMDSFRIKEISFKHRDLMLIGDVAKVRTWFDLNTNISYDSIKDIFIVKPNPEGFYDPQFNGNETLSKRLVKLFPPDVNYVF